MKKFIFPLILVAVVSILVGIFLIGNQSGSSKQSNKQVQTLSSPDNLPGLLTTKPPWDKNTDKLRERLQAMGLPVLLAEGTALHIHQHLDMYVNGQKIDLPPHVGIGDTYIADLHVHDTTGVMHVESNEQQDFTLGQFFDVWGVKFDKDDLGGLRADNENKIKVFVNGTEYKGDPRQLKLEAHQEIVVAYGTDAQLPNPIPSSYTFPANE
jgi:hypothetical protein